MNPATRISSAFCLGHNTKSVLIIRGMVKIKRFSIDGMYFKLSLG